MTRNRITNVLQGLLVVCVIMLSIGASWAGQHPTESNKIIKQYGLPVSTMVEPTLRPTVIVATAIPKWTRTPTVPPTWTPLPTTIIPTGAPQPTSEPTVIPIMNCTPDDVHRYNLAKLDHEQVNWLKSGANYSIFRVVDTNEQVCVGVGGWDVNLYKYEVNGNGLSNRIRYDTGEYWAGFMGQATIEMDGYGEAKTITVETPKEVGSNDWKVLSVWPEQMKKINQAGAKIFSAPIYDEKVDYGVDDVASLCFDLGAWEKLVPIPESVNFCHLRWQYDVDQYPGNALWLTDNRTPDGLLLNVFWVKPETQYLPGHPEEPVKYEDAGVLTSGEDLGANIVVKTACQKPKSPDFTSSYFRDPVVVELTNGLTVAMPRQSFVGVGTEDGYGWEKVYRVCP